MPLKIVRNDLTKMHVDVVVNTANESPQYASGVDTAIYRAAGVEKLLSERKKIGWMREGEIAITPGFKLPAKYIIHAVSPRYIGGTHGEEQLLRGCYSKSLQLAYDKKCKSIAFPLISTGSFGYPKEEGMSIAIDEINKFILRHDMMIYLVVFDTQATELALRLQPALDAYIDHHYVCEKSKEEYSDRYLASISLNAPRNKSRHEEDAFDFFDIDETALSERMKHLSDMFQEYLFYLIKLKGLSNPEVYTQALITKQTFSKIKNNPKYHPNKATALRLCVGARLSLDETKDLLARAGYALSPCDKRDIIFQFYIENKVYNMTAIDISLEEHGLPCFIE